MPAPSVKYAFFEKETFGMETFDIIMFFFFFFKSGKKEWNLSSASGPGWGHDILNYPFPQGKITDVPLPFLNS